MKILKTMKTDGTYNQDEQSNRLRERAGHQAESIDLSSATDRFPLKLQKVIIQTWFGLKQADAWEKVMIDRDFHTPTSTVRYSVGQPMGFYSSWAIFALTHHAFVEFAAHRKGFQSFRDYSLLGDDIVI